MGLIGSNAVRKRLGDAGHGCSLPALRRFGCRPAEDNRFPTPLRDPTGRRLWWEQEVDTWLEREAQRRAPGGRAKAADLVPDSDPARWAPGARRAAHQAGAVQPAEAT